MKANNSLPESKNKENGIQLELDLSGATPEPVAAPSKIVSFEKFKKQKEDEDFYRDVHETVARLIKKYK